MKNALERPPESKGDMQMVLYGAQHSDVDGEHFHYVPQLEESWRLGLPHLQVYGMIAMVYQSRSGPPISLGSSQTSRCFTPDKRAESPQALSCRSHRIHFRSHGSLYDLDMNPDNCVLTSAAHRPRGDGWNSPEIRSNDSRIDLRAKERR